MPKAKQAPKLLLVDDDPTILRMFSKLISNMREPEYEITAISNSDEAIHAAIDQNFDICLLDIRLDHASGFEVMEHIHRHRPYCPIIMITALDESEELELQAVSSGATDVVYKQQDLEATLAKVMRIARIRHEVDSRLRIAASIDLVTGAHNRAHFVESCGKELRRSARDDKPASVVFLDLDHFKQVNDQHGHLVGDQVLHSVAEHLKNTARTTDLIARYGGDEFVALLPNTNAEQANAVAEKLRLAVLKANEGIQGINISASCGVASTSQGHDSTEKLLQAADSAAYVSKSAGKNIVTIWADGFARAS